MAHQHLNTEFGVVRAQQVVGVAKQQELTGSLFDGKVARRAQTTVRLAQYPNALISRRLLRQQLVGIGERRTIIDDQDLQVAMRLTADRCHRRIDRVAIVVERHGDRDLVRLVIDWRQRRDLARRDASQQILAVGLLVRKHAHANRSLLAKLVKATEAVGQILAENAHDIGTRTSIYMEAGDTVFDHLAHATMLAADDDTTGRHRFDAGVRPVLK